MNKYKPKNYPENWTAEQWIQWAYKIGLKLDKVIPEIFGYDNRWRIEQAIEMLLTKKELSEEHTAVFPGVGAVKIKSEEK